MTDIIAKSNDARRLLALTVDGQTNNSVRKLKNS